MNLPIRNPVLREVLKTIRHPIQKILMRGVYRRIEQLEYRSFNRRYYAVEQLAEYLVGAQLTGDYVEFGVAQGATFIHAYRTMASGILAEPHVIQKILRESGKVALDNEHGWPQINVNDNALVLIQEGLRGVVRLPTGTAHALDSHGFPVAVMGKTGTTNNFRDALFVGSTYGPEGITVAVRIGFDDNRSLGPGETGSRVALPVFREVMLAVYREKLVGSVPQFPPQMEQSIDDYLKGGAVETATVGEPIGRR